MIAEERTFQEEAELRRQKEERLAAEARARDEALAAELRDAIGATRATRVWTSARRTGVATSPGSWYGKVRYRGLAKNTQRDEALAAELRDAILLAVSSKDFIPSNARAGRYSDYLTFRVAYENTSGRDIRAFRGRVRFTDLFGDEIYAFGITIQDPIVSGAHGTWDGQIDYNEFVDDHVRVRQTDLDDMRVEWLPSGVIFADGTQLGEVPDR